MSEVRLRIERFFEAFTHIIYRNRIKVLMVMFVIIAGLAGQVKDIVIDASTEEMLHDDDPYLVQYDRFREQFGKSELVLIMVEPPEVFDAGFINRLTMMHNDLEHEIPYLRDVTSLVNSRSTRGDGDTLIVDDLLKSWSDKTMSLDEIRSFALKNQYYLNNIISPDGKFTALIVETNATKSESGLIGQILGEDDFDEDMAVSGGEEEETKLGAKETAEINDAIYRVIHRYQARDFKVAVTGGPIMVDVFNRTTDSDMKRFVLITTSIIALVLALLFRRITGLIYPFIIVYSSMFSTLGLMVIFGTPISMMTTVIPSFLTAVGIADAVHVLAIFYRKYQEGVGKEEAICYAMGHSGLAIVMTSVTTAAGLLSFSFAEISTISEMGVYASAGVILALLYTMILLPALISLFPVFRKKTPDSDETPGIMDRVLLWFARISTGNPGKILVVCTVCLVISIVYCFRLEFSSNIVNYFPKNHPDRVNLKHVEEQLNGTITVEVIVDTKKENGIHDPGILKSIESLSRELVKVKNDDIHVGKVFSIIDIVKETNQALHGNDSTYYRIPDSRAQIAQELLLFENTGSDDLEKITDTTFSKARVTIKTKWADSVAYEIFVAEVEQLFESEFGDRAEIVVTGMSALLARTIPAALNSMVESYVIALVVITILMLILVGNLKLGFLSMYPNLLPIIMVMGLIAASGINLDINTLFIGSIAIGLVVDDTIHFMYNFRKYYDITGDPVKAVEETLLGTGRAMLITSLVLCSNFFILITATLNHTTRFGFFTGIVVVLALLADFVLAPALMMLATKPVEEEDGAMVGEPVVSVR